MSTNQPRQWYEDHDQIVLLTAYLANHGEDAKTVAYAVEKPWKFGHEYEQACNELAADQAELERGQQ